MASYQHLLQHTKPRFESPAKVFAKLKSRVQREGMCARDEGAFKGKGPLCSVREQHGAESKSPRKRAESTWMTDELKENHRFGSYRNEAQALTLSPISSPQKTFGCSYADISSKPVEEMPPVCTPRKGAFLESTAVSYPLSLVNRQHTEPPQIRDLDVFKVTGRTPAKVQPVEKDCAPLDKLTSPAYMFSPMRKRLRKRKWEPLEFNKVSSSTKEVSCEALRQPQERKTSTSEDDTHNNTSTEDLGHVRGFSAGQVTRDTVFPLPRSTAKKGEMLLLLPSK